jgi:arylsulfatase A-like enzyme
VAAAAGLHRGFAEVTAVPAGEGADYNDNAERVHRAALDWLAGLPPKSPVLLYVHSAHPQIPLDPPEPYLAHFTEGIDSRLEGSRETLSAIRRRRLRVTPDDRQRLRALYAASLAYVDRELAGLLAAIAERRPAEELLGVFTSDHGEELFDHDGVLHGATLYEEQLHVPLVLWWPGEVPVARLALPTDTLDVRATLAALVGADDPGPGRPLWAVLARGGASRPVRFAAAAALPGGIYMARTARYKLVWAPRTGRVWGMGDGPGRSYDAEYVFDLVADPGERENIAGAGPLEVDWLRSRLRAWLAAHGGAGAPGTGQE